MPLFGFFSGTPGWQATDALRSHAHRAQLAHSSPGGRSPIDQKGLAWGTSEFSKGSLTVALAGRPLFRGSGSTPWRHKDHPAAAVLEGYEVAGDDVLLKLGGRFAVAVLDASRGRALLAVDPMGIERITYSCVDRMLVFGTSAEVVARCPGRVARLAPQAIFDYLMLHMVPGPGTIFEGVQKLRPGHCLVFEDGRMIERSYRTSQFAESAGADVARLDEQLHQALRTAVRDCQPGESSGAFLSGGLDSSTVAGVLSEVGRRPTRTFTIGFGYADYDELHYSRTANAHFGCEGHEYTVTGDDIADGFPLIARAYDEPFGNSSALPVYYCARLARDHGVDHLLAGDGGDELFAGNSRYAEQQVFERYRRLPRFLRRGLIEPALLAWPDSLGFWLVRKGRSYVEKANVPLPARLEMWNLMHRVGTAEMLHPEFRAVIDERGTLAQMQALWDSAPAASTLGHMLYYDWQYTLADNDLRKVQTMSALAGVRVSYPMLHPDVVELSMRIPPDLMMPGTRLRDFYKRAMTGFLPDEIIHKKKHGFGLPFGLWLQETPRLREQIDGNLAALQSRQIIRPEFIDRLRHLHGQEDAKYYGVFIWVLAMLEQWLQEHKVSV